jgi:uncharacterized DUF497 family protein
VKIDGFDWDSGNLMKSEAKHELTRDAIEEFFRGEVGVTPDPKHSTAEDRFFAIGRGPSGKPMIVAFTFRTRDGLKLIRPISARFMHSKETKKYEQAFTQNEK